MHTGSVLDQRTVGRSTSGLAYELAGTPADGDPIVLVHAGVADRRMWDPIWARLTTGHRVLRYDVRGYGESLPPSGPWSQHSDLLELLDELGIRRAHLVGASMGAGVAVEAALARPSLVRSLVVAAPGGAIYGDVTDDLRAVWHDEVEALDRGDLDAAVEVNLRAWVDGPARDAGAVDPDVRAFIGRMQRDAFELPEWDPDDAPESELSPPASARLAEIACPTLVFVGEADRTASLEAAAGLEASLAGAEVIRWPDVGHMLVLERPAEFADRVLDFVDRIEGRGTPAAVSPAAARPLRYVALGDSYTIGTATGDPAERWPDQLVARLAGGSPSLELVANLGVNGYTSQDVIELEIPALPGLEPDFVTLLVGVNDVVQRVPADAYAANVAAILDALVARLPRDRILTVSTPDYTVTPRGADYGDPIAQAAGILRNNEILRDAAAARAIEFVEIYDVSLRAPDDRTLVASDGLHPSGAQYALWVDRIEPVVRRLLGGPTA